MTIAPTSEARQDILSAEKVVLSIQYNMSTAMNDSYIFLNENAVVLDWYIRK